LNNKEIALRLTELFVKNNLLNASPEEKQENNELIVLEFYRDALHFLNDIDYTEENLD